MKKTSHEKTMFCFWRLFGGLTPELANLIGQKQQKFRRMKEKAKMKTRRRMAREHRGA
jgi:hypothetical protein